MPEQEQEEGVVCVHCKQPVVCGQFVRGEWAHAWGGRWCIDRNGFTSTPLQAAQPVYHGTGDVL